MTQADHVVPSMPELAMLADNGGIVTVNPEWCDWYEQVFNEPAGAGYIKGREIMHQVDQSYSELLSLRSEAMKSAIHAMISNDPNRPTVHFNRISEARKSFDLQGKHALDFDKVEQVFTFDGYFSVSDMEAILFIRRAEDLIDKAKEHFSGFFDNAAAHAEDLDINQLMQVMQPGLERTDIHSDIFAKPVDAASYFGGSPNRAAMMGGKSPMAEQFNSIVEAKAVLTESGILRQHLSRAVNGSFMIDGFFTPKDLEAILYLYRNNDPMEMPAKDANGLPKDDPTAGVLNRKTFMELLGVTPESTGDEIASKLRAARLAIFGELPTGNARLNQLLTEGGGLRRGEFAQFDAARTPRSKTQLVGGLPLRSFEESDPDYSILKALIHRANNFSEEFPGQSLESVQGTFKALEDFGPMFFTLGDGGVVFLSRYVGMVKENLISFKSMAYSNPEGQIVVVEHDPETLSYGEIREFIQTFNAITPARLEAAKRTAYGVTHDRPLLDITGVPVGKYLLTSLPGANSVEKDLSLLMNMSEEEFTELGSRITETLGEGTRPEEDEYLKGITHRDYLKVAILRLKGEI